MPYPAHPLSMRHLYPLRGVLYALGALLLSSCATTPSLYGWGNYEATSYAVAKTPSEQNLQRLIQVYEELITHPKGTRQLPPPGICAEYGYLLIKQGKPEEGSNLLERDMAFYQEISIFIQTLLKRLF